MLLVMNALAIAGNPLRCSFLIKLYSCSGWSSKSSYIRWYSRWSLAPGIIYERWSRVNGG